MTTLKMVMRVYDNYLEIFIQNEGVYKTEKNEVILFLKKFRLIFTDLKVDGVEIIRLLKQNDVHIKKINSYNLLVYSIWTEWGVIKCYNHFGIEFTGDYQKLYKSLEELDDFVNFYLKSSLAAPKLNSLAAVSLKLLDKNSGFKWWLDIENSLKKYVGAAYVGGRCELFKPGYFKNVSYFDFPSMYGNIMMGKFPTIIGEVVKNGCLDDGVGFFEVTVFQKKGKFPVLPLKTSCGLFFVEGVFKGVFWWEELQLFKQQGGEILEYHSFLSVSGFENLFKNVVEPLLDLKKNKVKFAKQLINNIYGGLPIKKSLEKTDIYFDFNEAVLLEEFKVSKYVKYDDIFIIKTPYKNLKEFRSNLVAAAIITSRARIKLYNLMVNAELAGYEVLYVDTDSCFAVKNNSKTINDLNFLKWEVLESAEFYCEKNYFIVKSGVGHGVGSIKTQHRSFKRKNINQHTSPYNSFDFTTTLMSGGVGFW